MSDRVLPTLDELLADPERAMDLTRAQAARLHAAATLRLTTPEPPSSSARNGHVAESDLELLTAEELAKLFKLDVKQVYRRAADWPFTVRPSEGTLRFRKVGALRFISEGKLR